MLAGTVPPSEYLISSTVLDANTPSVTFDNLAQYAGVYKHLQIVAVVRHSAAANENYTTITFNGSNFVEAHYFVGTGSSIFSGRDGLAYLYSTAGNCVSNNFGVAVADILDPYSTTKNKTLRVSYGYTDPAIHRGGGIMSSLWENTASLTSITCTSQSNYVAGSRFSLYGVTA